MLRKGYKADIACGVRVLNDWILRSIIEQKDWKILFQEEGLGC